MSEFNPFAASDEVSEYVPEEVVSEESASGSKRNVVALGALAAVAVGAGAFFFLGGGGDEALEEYVPEEVVSEESASGSKRNVVALGALAAVAVGAGAFLFLGGGGDEELEEYVPAARAPRAAAPAADAGPVSTLPVASKVTLGRNPFRALYVEPVAAAAPAGGTTTSPTTTSGGTTTTPVVIVDSGSSTGGSTSGGTTAPPPAAPAPAPAQSTVALKSVTAAKDGSNPTATFDYDGKTVSGAPGDVMAGKLLVISIQQDAMGGWFVNLQLGDGEPFEVHERQRVVVQ